jgi:hypothetical protein
VAGQAPQGPPPATGHWRQYVTSDTLQAVDLQGKSWVVVIDRVVPAQMSDRKDPKKSKGVLNVYFRGKRKPLVVKAELAGVISKLVGATACAKWIGAAIEIYPTTVYAFGAVHEVVRISSKRPSAEQAKAAGGRPPEPEPPDTDLDPDEIREGDASTTSSAGTADGMTDAEKRAIALAEAEEAKREAEEARRGR